MRSFIVAGTLAIALAVGTGAALASDTKGSHSGAKGSHSGAKGSHSGHEMKAVEGNKEAVAVGIINSVDADGGKINITHEPVPALGWPKMTMDLPVTRRVDLSSIKAGSSVSITLKQGRDKQFRVMAIEPKK